jgi:hypothetical protein
MKSGTHVAVGGIPGATFMEKAELGEMTLVEAAARVATTGMAAASEASCEIEG